MRAGLSLSDVPERLDWEDFHAVLLVEARTPGSPLDRALRGDLADWNPETLLLREILQAVNVVAWLTAGGTESGADYPERIPLHQSDEEDEDAGAIDFDEYVSRYGPTQPPPAID